MEHGYAKIAAALGRSRTSCIRLACRRRSCLAVLLGAFVPLASIPISVVLLVAIFPFIWPNGSLPSIERRSMSASIAKHLRINLATVSINRLVAFNVFLTSALSDAPTFAIASNHRWERINVLIHGHMIDTLLLLALNGLIWGLTIALIALGLSIIFGLLDIINLAHGDFFMVGTVLAWFTLELTGNLSKETGDIGQDAGIDARQHRWITCGQSGTMLSKRPISL
jgi:hypothetical protein